MKILVTGATGNIGRKVVDHLLARGHDDIRALTTDPAKAALPADVEVVIGYLRRLESLPAAFDGVDAMYLAPTPETVQDVMRLAREAGVKRVVDLSGEHESWWGTVSMAVEASGLAYTHLSPADFMENTLHWAPQIIQTDAVHEPYPHGRSVPIAMDDIARVAAVALTEPGFEGRTLSMTGPEVLTRVDLAERIGIARGRPVEFRTVTAAKAAAELASTMGANAEWYVDNVLAWNVDAPAEILPTVEQVTGVPATPFIEWARLHADRFLSSSSGSRAFAPRG